MKKQRGSFTGDLEACFPGKFGNFDCVRSDLRPFLTVFAQHSTVYFHGGLMCASGVHSQC